MKRAVLLATALFLLSAGAAEARTTIVGPPDARFPYQRWVDRAKVPTPALTLGVVEDASACGGPVLGCAMPTAIHLAAVADRRVFFHELGHLFDLYVLTDAERARALAILRLAWPWRSEQGTQSPHEWFADGYRLCAMRPLRRIRHANSMGSGVVGWRAARRLCWLIRRAPEPSPVQTPPARAPVYIPADERY